MNTFRSSFRASLLWFGILVLLACSGPAVVRQDDGEKKPAPTEKKQEPAEKKQDRPQDSGEKDVWKACEADFDYKDAHMYVQVTLNDKGPFKFAFDNGYEYGSITSSASNKSGAGSKPAIMKLGNKTVKNATFLTGGGPAAPNTDGMLGSDFVRAFVITIDYPKRKLYIMDKKVFAEERDKIKNARTVKAETAGPFLVITATLDGKGPLRFCHDTGTNGNFLILPRHAKKVEIPDKAVIKAVSIEAKDGGKPFEITDRKIRVFDHMGVSTFAAKYKYHGTVGNMVFDEEKITLDYEKGQIIVWERDKK